MPILCIGHDVMNLPADARVPISNLKTQAPDIDQRINQEIVFA
jgi:hypothetical protein